MSERRDKRITFGESVYFYSSSISEGFIGKIIDIDITGISFSYLVEFPPLDGMKELGILIPKTGSVLSKLPFKTISDEIIPGHPYSSIIVRRRTGSFQNLTPEQVNELKSFIDDLEK